MHFERPVEQWFDGNYSVIPQRMRDGLVRYVVDHLQPGSFLTAVICNDLAQAVGHADADNLPLLKTYVEWFYNVPPASCKGSREAMTAWLAKKPATV